MFITLMTMEWLRNMSSSVYFISIANELLITKRLLFSLSHLTRLYYLYYNQLCYEFARLVMPRNIVSIYFLTCLMRFPHLTYTLY